MLSKKEAYTITIEERKRIKKMLADEAYAVGDALISKAIKEKAEKGLGRDELWFSNFGDTYPWIDGTLVKYQEHNSSYNCGVCSDVFSLTTLREYLRQHEYKFTIYWQGNKMLKMDIEWA